MNNQNIASKKLFLLLLMIIALVMFTALNSCVYQGGRTMDLIIENQTDQVLNIIVNEYPVGEVKSGSKITRHDTSMYFNQYIIEAKNTHSQIVFSKAFTFEELIKIDNRVYKVIILPLSNNSTTSENVAISDNISGQ